MFVRSREVRPRGKSGHQSFDLCQDLILGKVFLAGGLAGTDGRTGPAAFAQGFVDHRDSPGLEKING